MISDGTSEILTGGKHCVNNGGFEEVTMIIRGVNQKQNMTVKNGRKRCLLARAFLVMRVLFCLSYILLLKNWVWKSNL